MSGDPFEKKRLDAFLDGKLSTTSRETPKHFGGGAPDPEIDPTTGQHKSYWVLSESERAKGFVRPVRNAYRHVGTPGPVHPLRDLTDEEKERYADIGYVKCEVYPESMAPVRGRFWTQAQLDSIGKGGCGSVTTMSQSIAETYAREPHFYGSTFCSRCRTHIPVGKDGEFVWVDENGRTTKERVGT